ncbi:hypothetical protein MA16_Dca007291 [Dendrobium catenatum]|uniref:Uncharacterized protein n=1 Tax=Dendrobium catenatum TaxID=906689 RepID=A0A2I0W6K6_9ASPA|nr:hypothetical protein MA16_Dca007291 [Dendrobium catenatum]
MEDRLPENSDGRNSKAIHSSNSGVNSDSAVSSLGVGSPRFGRYNHWSSKNRLMAISFFLHRCLVGIGGKEDKEKEVLTKKDLVEDQSTSNSNNASYGPWILVKHRRNSKRKLGARNAFPRASSASKIHVPVPSLPDTENIDVESIVKVTELPMAGIVEQDDGTVDNVIPESKIGNSNVLGRDVSFKEASRKENDVLVTTKVEEGELIDAETPVKIPEDCFICSRGNDSSVRDPGSVKYVAATPLSINDNVKSREVLIED